MAELFEKNLTAFSYESFLQEAPLLMFGPLCASVDDALPLFCCLRKNFPHLLTITYLNLLGK